MSEYRIVRDYRHSQTKVWRALTDPALVPLWTSTGQGGRPVGFLPVVGTRFKLVAKPMPGWSGVVDCELLEATEPWCLRYSWRGDGDAKDETTVVTCLLEPHHGGTRLNWEHTGFKGLGGWMMSKLLGRVRKKMLDVGFPAVLDDLDDEGKLRSGSALRSNAA